MFNGNNIGSVNFPSDCSFMQTVRNVIKLLCDHAVNNQRLYDIINRSSYIILGPVR